MSVTKHFGVVIATVIQHIYTAKQKFSENRF